MSYQVIARKWRPQTFEEVTGQEVITHTLRNAIKHDRLHHAYLFSGARGVGKTTSARLLAKSLNCHKTTGPNLTPCSSDDGPMCPSCLEISESRSIDVLEIDAASHTGIDDVRGTILESINFNPARDRFKVFIIDEVHMLSKSAFNALLKTLEEPPPNVVFVMATTELHKVPDTILSRCQEFQFRTIPLQKIFDRLRLIANAEKIDIADDALREISRSGEGSMRDAQSNFDQVISFSGDKITSVDVTNALGFASVEILKRVIHAIAIRDARDILSVVDDLVARGHDLRNFCRDLLGLFRDMLVFKVAGDEPKLFETAVIGPDEMQTLSANFTESDLLRFFNALAETETKLKEASHSRYVLEIGLVKLIEMRRVEAVETLLKRLDALENGHSGGNAAPALTASVPQPNPVVAEKKTLNIEPPARKFVEPPLEQPPVEHLDEPIEEPPIDAFDPPEPELPPSKPVISIPKSTAPPVWLPPIPSEDLEHIEDTWLDTAYEEKLAHSGDDLKPLEKSSDLIADLLGGIAEKQYFTPNPVTNGHAAAATAPARAIPEAVPLTVIKDEDIELPVLGADPTEDELLAYAQAHPVVIRALKIFRGKIVNVEKSGG